MTKENTTNESLSHYIWEGSVGIRLRPRKRQDGEYFWTYEFVRCYKNDADEDFQYTHNFSERNDEAIGKVMARWIQFRSENAATTWVERQMNQAA